MKKSQKSTRKAGATQGVLSLTEQQLELARKKTQKTKLAYKKARKELKQAKKAAKLARKAVKKAAKKAPTKRVKRKTAAPKNVKVVTPPATPTAQERTSPPAVQALSN